MIVSGSSQFTVSIYNPDVLASAKLKDSMCSGTYCTFFLKMDGMNGIFLNSLLEFLVSNRTQKRRKKKKRLIRNLVSQAVLHPCGCHSARLPVCPQRWECVCVCLRLSRHNLPHRLNGSIGASQGAPGGRRVDFKTAGRLSGGGRLRRRQNDAANKVMNTATLELRRPVRT